MNTIIAIISIIASPDPQPRAPRAIIVIDAPAAHAEEVYRLARRIPPRWITTTNTAGGRVRIEGRKRYGNTP